MYPVEAFKPLGWISISITWASISFLIYKFRGHRGMSISKHAASHKQAYLMMALAESVVLSLFFIFIVKWFVPTFHLPVLFSVSIGLTSLGLLVAAWIPDVDGWSGTVHSLCAYGAAMLFIPAATLASVSPSISPFVRGIWLITFTYQLICPTLFVSVSRAKEYHLPLQAVYILLFHIAVLFTVYAR